MKTILALSAVALVTIKAIAYTAYAMQDIALTVALRVAGI